MWTVVFVVAGVLILAEVAVACWVRGMIRAGAGDSLSPLNELGDEEIVRLEK